MATERLKRINELAKLAKERGLTPAEREEQSRLRQEYLAAFRKNFLAQMDNVYLQEPDGTEHKLGKKP